VTDICFNILEFWIQKSIQETQGFCKILGRSNQVYKWVGYSVDFNREMY